MCSYIRCVELVRDFQGELLMDDSYKYEKRAVRGENYSMWLHPLSCWMYGETIVFSFSLVHPLV